VSPLAPLIVLAAGCAFAALAWARGYADAGALLGLLLALLLIAAGSYGLTNGLPA